MLAGKRSESIWIICRFSGIAMNSPRYKITAMNNVSFHQTNLSPVSIVSAGTAETNPAEEIQLAATATVIIMVFSMMPNSRRRDADACGGP